MAERVIAIKMNLDAGNSVDQMEQVETQISAIDKELKNLGAGDAEAVFEALNIAVDNTTLSVKQLIEVSDNYRKIAISAGETSIIGEESIKRANELDLQIKDITKNAEILADKGSSVSNSLKLGAGIISGFAAYQGIVAAIGVEDEDLIRTIKKMQVAQTLLVSVQELQNAVDAESFLMIKARAAATKAMAVLNGELTVSTIIQTAATKAWSKVTKVATVIQKALNLAMKLNPLGLVLLAITAIVGAFVLFGDSIMGVIKWMLDLKNIVYLLLTPIDLLIEAYNYLFGTTIEGFRDMSKSQLELNEEAERLHKAKIKMLEEERDAQIELLEEIQNRGKIQKQIDDLAILQAKARGDSEREIFDITVQQNEAALEMARQEYAAKQEIIRINHEIAQAEYDHLKTFLETQAIRLGWTEKQIEKDLKRLEIAKTDYLKAEEDKRLQSKITLETIEAQNKIFLNNRNKDSKKSDEDLAKQKAADKKKADKKAADDAKRTADFQRDLTDMKIGNIQDENDRELALLQEKFKRERDALIEKYGKGTELEKQLKIKQEREFAELEATFEAKRKEAAKAIRDAEQAIIDAEQEQNQIKFEAKLQEAESYIEKANLALQVASSVNDLLSAISEEKIEENNLQRKQEIDAIEKQKKKELTVEGLTEIQKAKIEKKFAIQEFNAKMAIAKKNDEIAEKQFKRDKKMRLAGAAIDMASAIVKAIAMFGPPPSPMGMAGIAAAGIIGGTQMAIIARQKFQGSATSISPPDITIPTADETFGGNPGGSNNGEPGGEIPPGTDIDDLLNTPIQVSIVEIENVQMQVAQIENIATL